MDIFQATLEVVSVILQIIGIVITVVSDNYDNDHCNNHKPPEEESEPTGEE